MTAEVERAEKGKGSPDGWREGDETIEEQSMTLLGEEERLEIAGESVQSERYMRNKKGDGEHGRDGAELAALEGEGGRAIAPRLKTSRRKGSASLAVLM